MTAYEHLANAVVKQAYDDYAIVLKELKKHPNDKSTLATKNYLERFFHSDWYTRLTTVNPEYVIRKLKEVI